MKGLKIIIAVALMVLAVGLVANATHKGVINVNTATVEQLKLLPSLNDTIAKNIVAYRKSNGPFKSMDDLVKVKGVTRTLLDDIRPFLALEGKTTFIPDESQKSSGHPGQD
ncbi:MAG: helix-hairpin-helix domain-containing protein [Syntrophaceae bacterium]|nr:helix-hairpin-helix domain-containing protein [Deltaproteobacteria bacterium]